MYIFCSHFTFTHSNVCCYFQIIYLFIIYVPNNKTILRKRTNNLNNKNASGKNASDKNDPDNLTENDIKFRNLLSKVKNLSKNVHNSLMIIRLNF